MTLCIKTGMSSEEAIAKIYAPKGALVLSGALDMKALSQAVPPSCTGIISFGLCGGLWTGAQIGQAFVYYAIKIPSIAQPIFCDEGWRQRLFDLTHYYECKCCSSGEFNTANTIEERATLYTQTDCKVIDDETFAVAQVAQARKIPFIGLRVVSDGAEDNLPPAVIDALNSNGSFNLWNVAESVVTDPAQISALIKTAGEYEKSKAELRTAAIQLGPTWGLE
jgi:adenosylhomocysteine nucleosidase